MIRHFSFFMCAMVGLLGISTISAQAQIYTEDAGQDPYRYPGLGQGDVSPGSAALSRDIELTAAVGAALQPKFQGSDDYEAIFAPAIDFEYQQRVFLVIDRHSMMKPYDGLGYKLIANQDVTLGLNLSYDGGRDQSGHIRGLGDVDGTAMGGGFAVWHPGVFYVRGMLANDMLNEFNGYKGEFGLGLSGPLAPAWRGMLDLNSAFAGDNYHEAFFGVDAGQSAASGLSQYKAEGGFYRMGVAGTLQYQFTPGVFVQGILKYDRLVGDAADSPVSKRDSQWGLQGMVGYKF